ncbi:hypothetical protein DFH27DRAFT_541894 [Peziza echinospora]|nr:hypothetical protein DFH27DRAFT_541894 [Peziza echinospora]
MGILNNALLATEATKSAQISGVWFTDVGITLIFQTSESKLTVQKNFDVLRTHMPGPTAPVGSQHALPPGYSFVVQLTDDDFDKINENFHNRDDRIKFKYFEDENWVSASDDTPYKFIDYHILEMKQLDKEGRYEITVDSEVACDSFLKHGFSHFYDLTIEKARINPPLTSFQDKEMKKAQQDARNGKGSGKSNYVVIGKSI